MTSTNRSWSTALHTLPGGRKVVMSSAATSALRGYTERRKPWAAWNAYDNTVSKLTENVLRRFLAPDPFPQ